MKKLALAFVLVSGLSFAQVKKVVSSDVHWWGYKIAKTESSSHDGTVDVKSGSIVMKGNTIASGTFVLDMNTINATDLSGKGQVKLNAHLKNGDFFETDKYPTATYTITSVKKNKNKDYKFLVNGTLTAKGKTSKVSFPANITYENGTLTITSAKFSFDRQKFDIAYSSGMKDIVIKDEVDMQVTITAK
ncbi:MAG: YceI family protein [Bergeyella sp.]